MANSDHYYTTKTIKIKPKKPLTAYFRFAAMIRQDLALANPDKPITVLSKISAEMWKAADQDLKNRLQEEYKRDLLEYQEKFQEYDKLLTPSEREEIKRAKVNNGLVKIKKDLKKKKEQLGCPKRPPSSFILFSKAKAAERGTLSFRDWQDQLKKSWECITEVEKQKFNDLYKIEMEVYRQKLADWEGLMKAQGNMDVVRIVA